MKSFRLIRYWLPVGLWMAAIFIASTDLFSGEHTHSVLGAVMDFFIPGLSPEAVAFLNTVLRKLGHLTEYFILGWLLFRAFRADSPAGWRPGWAVWTFAIAVLYAAGDEWHQGFVATRTASALDVGIDSIGAALAVLVRRVRGTR